MADADDYRALDALAQALRRLGVYSSYSDYGIENVREAYVNVARYPDDPGMHAIPGVAQDQWDDLVDEYLEDADPAIPFEHVIDGTTRTLTLPTLD